MTESITITTGARLHFGLLVLGDPDHRTYGGIGLMVDQPGYVLTVRPAEQDRIDASPETTSRVTGFLDKLRATGSPGVWSIEVHEEIPAHVGLGSGTQLGMAIATAVSWLNDDLDAPLLELAKRVGRNARSAIGTIGFSVGGLIIDWGAPASGISESTFERLAFPQIWRFVLVTPPHEPGLSGAQELDAFRRLPSMTPKQVRQLRNYALSLQSAVESRQFQQTATALFEFGQIVGDYFSPIQNGIYANARMAALADRLRVEGIQCVGQTSWGPTLFALCESQQTAESVAGRVRESNDFSDCDVRIVHAMNHGRNMD